jgi:hypothetical protein
MIVRLAAGVLCATLLASASAAGNGTAAGAGLPTAGNIASAPVAQGMFSRPVVLTGTLGTQRIEANIRPKAEIDEGIEGEYFVFGQSRKILLAGELEGEDVFMEESENGTDVSGQWEGKRAGGEIRGTWSSPDGAVTKPFVLRASVAAPATGKKPSTRKSQAADPAAQPRH